MLLSDRDIKAEIAAERVRVDPYDEGMIQPSSIDVRLDRWFRVFENHRYPHIDPSVEQPDLTRLIEPEGDEPFILHPGELGMGMGGAISIFIGCERGTSPPSWDSIPSIPTKPSPFMDESTESEGNDL